jgi:hypothetical protein
LPRRTKKPKVGNSLVVFSKFFSKAIYGVYDSTERACIANKPFTMSCNSARAHLPAKMRFDAARKRLSSWGARIPDKVLYAIAARFLREIAHSFSDVGCKPYFDAVIRKINNIDGV